MLETQTEPGDDTERNGPGDEIIKLQNDFRSRLIAANLRTEAVRAGMVDLDGLKLVDLSGVDLDEHDKVIDGSKLMSELRRNKPWLFGRASSSSAAVAPASRPVKQKTAMEMSDEEYVAAKMAVTKYHI
ncbi:MAG TPA: hypothetical protein DDZ81_07845 [Acetobacteraceae bacterium]|jgi:hypothetical protein|nr:hypothetical protein [Acetobacteraceae bacterium]